MATEFDTGSPSIRQIQTLIRDQQTIDIKLLTGDVFSGVVLWQDAQAICLNIDGQPMLVMRTAVAYIKIMS